MAARRILIRLIGMPNRWRHTRPPRDPSHGAPTTHSTGSAGGGHVPVGGGGQGAGPPADPRWLSAALSLIVVFMAAEVVAGLAAHSLALISDAAHMLTDAGSLALVLVTARLAARPPKGGFTYGLKRAEILSAQANGLTLVLLGGGLGYQGIVRLVAPPRVAGGIMLGVALAGVAVNVAATTLVGRANRRSLNVEGAYRHILTDLYAFLATVAAGVVILLTGFARADAIASLAVVVLMLTAGARLIIQSGRIFLEAAPAGLSPAAIGAAMARRPHVVEVHDLHIWQITSGMPAASAHVLVAPGEDCHAVRGDLEGFLRRDHGITHTTLQVDHAPEPLLTVGRHPPAAEAGTPAEQAGDRHHAASPDAEPDDKERPRGEPSRPRHPG